MGARGRQQADLVCIDTQHLRLKPPEYLNKHEREIFELVVNSTSPDHFKRCELPLLFGNVLHSRRAMPVLLTEKRIV